MPSFGFHQVPVRCLQFAVKLSNEGKYSGVFAPSLCVVFVHDGSKSSFSPSNSLGDNTRYGIPGIPAVPTTTRTKDKANIQVPLTDRVFQGVLIIEVVWVDGVFEEVITEVCDDHIKQVKPFPLPGTFGPSVMAFTSRQPSGHLLYFLVRDEFRVVNELPIQRILHLVKGKLKRARPWYDIVHVIL